MNLLIFLIQKTKDLMDQKIENPDKKKSKKKRILLLVILLLLLGVGVLVGRIFWGDKNDAGDINNNLQEENISNTEEAQNDDENISDENLNNAENETEVNPQDEVEMVSENYRVSQVKFGGNVVIENGKTRDVKPEIYQVKSENIISQEDDEPRILISWKTNKEAISTVNYTKASGGSVVNVTEDGYGFDHTMLLKNMEFSTIYTYKIEAKDKWGNKVSTEYFSAYTGDESESIFDLITNAVEDVFGWAMK